MKKTTKMGKIMNETEKFHEILNKGAIYPVFQPLVSLEDGSVFGYEALSRIDLSDPGIGIERLFHIAKEEKCVWQLEELCRKLSLRYSGEYLDNKKLFLNVDAEVIHDKKFRSGITKEYLQSYNILSSQIVFEITERTSVENMSTFCSVIDHYKDQNYQIAIDDFGVDHSGIARLVALKPHYMKIDMKYIQGIDKDNVKQSLIKSFLMFCKNTNIRLIAEGIETYEELVTLIELGVPFGQGYYLQRPNRKITDIVQEVKDEIRFLNEKYRNRINKSNTYTEVGDICERNETVEPQQKAEELYNHLCKHTQIRQVTVVDNNHAVGIVTSTYMNHIFGGRYGYTLNSNKTIGEIMDVDFLEVEVGFSIVLVSQMAMERDNNHTYDDVIVSQSGKFIGTVSVKDLLKASISIQVGIAEQKNPLTGLPGNRSIEERVQNCINKKAPFSVAYLDIDNFKAYNDAYGFTNGDMMIIKMAECMKEFCGSEEFIGHIGGDDFVIIADNYTLQEKCYKIQEKFYQLIEELYSIIDWERGCINSKNRNGFSQQFPIASISIAIATNKSREFKTINAFSKEVAELKKKAKVISGNSLQMI